MGIGEQYELEKTGNISSGNDTNVNVFSLLEDFYTRVVESFNAYVSDVHGFTIPGKADIIIKFLENSHGNVQKLDAFEIINANLKKDFGNFDLNNPYQIADIVKRLVDDYYKPKKENNGCEIHKEFYDLIKQMVDTFERKNHDYAGSDAVDMMQNFMRCENFGIRMSDGIITRMSDKITRMENLLRTRQQKVKDESLIDTVMDLANYCLILTIALKRETKGTDNANNA